jgi:hypothetical protein
MTSAELESIRQELTTQLAPDVLSSTHDRIAGHFRCVSRCPSTLWDAIVAVRLFSAMSESPGCWPYLHTRVCERMVTGAVDRAVDLLISEVCGGNGGNDGGLSDWRAFFSEADLALAIGELDDPESTRESALRLIASRLRIPRSPVTLGVKHAIEIVIIFRVCWGSGFGGIHAHPMALAGLGQYVCEEGARAAHDRAVSAICDHLDP